MESAYRRCCGIDVHKKSVTVCVLAPEGQRNGEVKKRVFRTFTKDLVQMRAWLKHCRVTEVAMESTGQYWRSVWNILEDQIAKLVLVNPQHIKGLAGQKTDSKDSAWIANLLATGNLRGSFVPPRAIRELRDLTRQRVHMLEEVNRVKNRAAQLCETANIKIGCVATDLFGVSGRKMLRALIANAHDIPWIADYAKGRLRAKQSDVREALRGTLNDHCRGMLQRLLDQLEWIEAEIEGIDRQLTERMAPYQDLVQRLVTIPGIERITAWTLISELGPDMSLFAVAKHLASWAGLCPGNRESGGKRLSGRTRKANRYVRRALCQAAWAASHTRQTYPAALYRRLRTRLGQQKAAFALAHHLLIVAFHVIRDGGVYLELGEHHYDQQNKPKAVRRLVQRLQSLGYYVTLQAAMPPGDPMLTDCQPRP
jgi:transposase